MTGTGVVKSLTTTNTAAGQKATGGNYRGTTVEGADADDMHLLIGTYRGLIIGIDKYKNLRNQTLKWKDLTAAVNDANEIYRL